MDTYNFWADLFATYRATADWVKALWIVSVPGFLLGVLALVLHYRLARALTGPALCLRATEGEQAVRFRRVFGSRP